MNPIPFYALAAIVIVALFYAIARRDSGRSSLWATLAFVAVALIITFFGNQFMQLPSLLFYIFSTAAIVAAFFVITRRNPVHSALWLIMVLANIAGMFILLGAEYLAAVQILIYAGAIIVIYIFIIMLIDFHKLMDRRVGYFNAPQTIIVGVALLAEIAYLLLRQFKLPGAVPVEVVQEVGNTEAIGYSLFSTFILPFEIASLLLLVGLVGAIVIGRREEM